MKERDASDFKVFANEGHTITISQYNHVELEDTNIWVHPDQIPLLIKWLEETAKEVENAERF